MKPNSKEEEAEEAVAEEAKGVVVEEDGEVVERENRF